VLSPHEACHGDSGPHVNGVAVLRVGGHPSIGAGCSSVLFLDSGVFSEPPGPPSRGLVCSPLLKKTTLGRSAFFRGILLTLTLYMVLFHCARPYEILSLIPPLQPPAPFTLGFTCWVCLFEGLS